MFRAGILAHFAVTQQQTVATCKPMLSLAASASRHLPAAAFVNAMPCIAVEWPAAPVEITALAIAPFPALQPASPAFMPAPQPFAFSTWNRYAHSRAAPLVCTSPETDSMASCSSPAPTIGHRGGGRSRSPQRRGTKRHLDGRGHRSSVSPAKKQRPSEKSALSAKWSKEEWDNLSLEIWDYYAKHRQTKEIYTQKLELRERIYNLLRTQYPYCGLYVVGSSMNGLGSKDSDMDLCFMVSLQEVDQRREAKEILLHVELMLKTSGMSRSIQLIHAKVPILKFVDRLTGIEVDLNVNNSVGIRNTYLLACYAKLDWRVPPLVLVIKRWAKDHGINDAKNQTISSYSLVMMVIHYLQVGCTPPILPSVQALDPDRFNPDADIRSLSMPAQLPQFRSENNWSLGELLLGFLHYYTNVFDYRRSAISVRLGRAVPRHEVMYNRSPKNDANQWKFLCIEEPFDRTNTARSVYCELPFRKILKVFRVSWGVLRDTKSLKSLIFPKKGSHHS